MLGRILSVAAVAACLVSSAASAAAAPHPDSFPARLRHGPLYAAAKAQHESLSDRAVNSTASWITQPIFHTGAAGEPTFQQRYYVDYSALIASGFKSRNLMLYINGESAVDSTPNGFIQTFADNFSAPIITLEHRFYGDSMPYNLTDYTNVYKALTVDYALQDMKYFVDYFVANVLVPMIRANDPTVGPNDTVPITVFCGGGSYSGALSSWMKQKYPDTFKFAWSSSGVVYPMFDFTTFDGHVKHVISSNCLSAVQQAMQQFSVAYDINATYVTSTLLQSESYFAKTDLAWMLADGSAMQVQYGSKETLCTTLLDPNLAASLPFPQDATTLLLQRLVLSIQMVWGASFTSNCYYSTECLANQKYQSQWGAAGYSWVAQTCFQMGWWQVGYRNSIRLPIITTEYYTNQCRAVFRNASLIANVYQFNAVYGGRTANTAVNVIATQGSDDPWSEAGMRVGIPAQNYFVYWAQCPGCGHCGDMQVATPTDPANLVAQRQNLLAAANAMYNNLPVPGSNSNPSSATTGTKNNSKVMAAIFCSLAVGVVLLIAVAVTVARRRKAAKNGDADYAAGLNRGESAFP